MAFELAAIKAHDPDGKEHIYIGRVRRGVAEGEDPYDLDSRLEGDAAARKKLEEKFRASIYAKMYGLKIDKIQFIWMGAFEDWTPLDFGGGESVEDER